MKNSLTTRDIARKCNLSQSTVSMVLSGREDISFRQETVDKMIRTAEKMGYVYKKRPKKPESTMKKTVMIMWMSAPLLPTADIELEPPPKLATVQRSIVV